MPKSSQKGVIFLPLMILAMVIVGAGVIGVRSGLLKLTASPSNVGSPTNVFDRAPAKSSPTPVAHTFSNLDESGQGIETDSSEKTVDQASLAWISYSSQDYGYSLGHPEGWSVSDVPADDHREIKVMDPAGRAFVLISAYQDPSINSVENVEIAISYREEAVNVNGTVDKFESGIEGEVGGYLATGTETFNDFTVKFQERGLFGTNGKILLFHGVVVPEYMSQYSSVVTKIIESFQLE